MIRGAIFDADGTLLDSMGIWKDAGIRYLNSLQIRAEADLSEILFPMTLEQGAEYLKGRYQLPQDTDAVVEGVLQMVQDYYDKEAPLKAGVVPFLEALRQKGIPAVIATSSSHNQIETACKRLGISRYFKRILTCSEIGAGKSSPLIYQKAAKILGTVPQQTWVFEDVLHAIRTAKEAGFCTVGIYDQYSAGDTAEITRQADLYLPDFTDFNRFWKVVSA